MQEHGGLAGSAHAVRCAGQNHCAGREPRTAAEKFYQRRHVEDHVVRIPVLHGLAIEDGTDAEVIGVGNLVRRRQARPQWAKGRKGLAAAPLAAAEFHLPVAGAHIVSARVPQYIVESARLRDVVTLLL